MTGNSKGKAKEDTIVWEEVKNIKPEWVKLSQVYLDPNNPRLELPNKNIIPDNRITNDEVQKSYLEKLKEEGLDDLLGSITASGFLSIDRIVLRPIESTGKFVVVEGNRRIATLKILDKRQKDATINLGEKHKTILDFEALVYKGKNPAIAWLIQGIRHTPGSKSWESRGNKYPKAKFFAKLKNTGKPIVDIAIMFGLDNSEVTHFIRSYYAFEQAKSNEEFGDKIDKEKFGYFDEIILKNSELKEKWLGWDDNKMQFKKVKNLKKFLFWITSGKIDTISRSTSKTLTKLIQNKNLLSKFELENEMTISQCEDELRQTERSKRPITNLDDTIVEIKNAKDLINTLPVPELRIKKSRKLKQQKAELSKLLKEIIEIAKFQIKNLDK